MCTGAEIALVAMAAATVVSAYGQMEQGKAARRTADYQAALADNNAIAAQQQAELDERQQREKALRLMATQRARASKGGVLAEQGSPLFINLDMGEKAEIGALNIRRGGEIRANELRAQGALARYQGELKQQEGNRNATVSLLQGTSQVAKGGSTASGGTGWWT
jgi:hypothetical protein